MPSRILVTAVTGDVGREVFDRLIAAGLPATAAARNPAKASSTGRIQDNIVLFDYDRPESFEPALAGIERLFIVPPPLHPRWHQLIEPLMVAAVNAGVRHVVNLSQMGAEDIEGLPLRMAELLIERSGIAYTHLRPNWFMQTYNNSVLEGSSEQGQIRVPAAEGKASFVDMRDIAAVAVCTLSSDAHMNKTYTLTGAESLDHYAIARILSEAAERRICYTPISEQDLRADLTSANLSDEQIDIVVKLYQLLTRDLLSAVSPDVAAILGRPPISFEQYAKDYAGHWQSVC